jgi:glycosyltransferase 2 family protein
MPEADSPAPRRRLRYGGFVARAVVVVAIYIVIFYTIDVAGALSKLHAATAWAFLAGVLLLMGQIGLCTARWRLLVAAPYSRPEFVSSYCAILESLFVNQALPSTLGGDAWRVVRWRRAGLSTRAAASSVLLDRLSGAMGAAILAICASWPLSLHGVDVRWTLSIFSLGALVLVCGATFIVLVRGGNLHLLRLIPAIHVSIAKIKECLVPNRVYVVSLVYSIAAYCVCGLAVYVAARSLAVDLSLALMVGVTASALLIAMVPISIAGWGVREASFVTLLVPLGVNKGDALVIGILFGLSSLASSLPGGLCLLINRGADGLRDQMQSDAHLRQGGGGVGRAAHFGGKSGR